LAEAVWKLFGDHHFWDDTQIMGHLIA